MFAIGELAAYPQQSVLAVDRREIVPDRIAALQSAAEARRTRPLIVPIISADCPPSLSGAPHEGVRRMIHDAPVDYASEPHVVLVVTHQGLMSSDLGHFGGWRIWVDEIPSILESVSFRHNAWTLTALRSSYDLERVSEGVSLIRDRRLYSLGDMTAAGLPQPLLRLHTMVMTGEARLDAESWDEIGSRDAWMAWSIASLADRFGACQGLAILGDAFQDHTTGQLLARDPTVELQRLDMTGYTARTHASRQLRIEYFDAIHDGSSYRFKSEEFAAELDKVAGYLARVGNSSQLIATNNGADFRIRDVLQARGVQGQYLSPLQAGSNRYSAVDEATMFYSAKPSVDEIAVLSRMGLSRDQIIDAREHYAVNQFMMRTSARDPDSARPLVWRVWGKSCAEYLKRKVEAHYPYCVTVEHIELGLAAAGSKPKGRPRKQTDEEREASRAKTVAKQKAKRRAVRARP